jgi:hypothetical protein
MLTSQLSALTEEALHHGRDAEKLLGSLPTDISISTFITAYSNVGAMGHYRSVPAKAKAMLQGVATALGPVAARHFLRAAVGRGIVELVHSDRLQTLPERIVRHQVKQLARIASSLARDDESFDLENDLFLKDFGLVTLRLYAAAAQLLDIRCGIPRSIVWREGPAKVPRNLERFWRLGGFKPFIQIHTHLRNREDFSEAGWNECYRCCADLYEQDTHLLGMFGSSWFYDPALARISPRLDYLRDIPLQGGARLFFVERGGEAIGNALSTSASRRQLFDEGKYMPTSFMLIWDRQSQVRWAARNPDR